MRAVQRWNKQHPPSEQIHPHGFVLTCLVAPLGTPPDVEPDRFRPVAPYESDPKRWTKLEWFNLNDPTAPPLRAVTRFEDHVPGTFVAATYRDVLRRHARQPETKLSASDGTTCGADTRGLLQRRHIHIDPDNIVWVGKEAGELTGLPTNIADDLDDARTTYGTSVLNRLRLEVLNTMNKSQLAERVGVDRGTIRRVLNGITKNPGAELENKLAFEAHLHVRRQLRAGGITPPRSEYDCLSEYISMIGTQDQSPSTA
jgi:transcriptional regulator with XRE-family HTH domain